MTSQLEVAKETSIQRNPLSNPKSLTTFQHACLGHGTNPGSGEGQCAANGDALGQHGHQVRGLGWRSPWRALSVCRTFECNPIKRGFSVIFPIRSIILCRSCKSPFLLAGTIQDHLQNEINSIAEKIKDSLIYWQCDMSEGHFYKFPL